MRNLRFETMFTLDVKLFNSLAARGLSKRVIVVMELGIQGTRGRNQLPSLNSPLTNS